MLQPRRDPDLAQKALGAKHGAEFGLEHLEHLERHAAVVTEVARQENRRYSAGSDLSLHDVSAGEAGIQLRDGLRARDTTPYAHLGQNRNTHSTGRRPFRREVNSRHGTHYLRCFTSQSVTISTTSARIMTGAGSFP
jgi:hypothetical protein